MTTQTVITVGHGAYTGANALRTCFSKAQAVRVLRARGVKRDDARKAVKVAAGKPSGYATVRSGFEPIEVRNEQWSIEQGHFAPIEMLRKFWATKPEA